MVVMWSYMDIVGELEWRIVIVNKGFLLFMVLIAETHASVASMCAFLNILTCD